MRSAYGTAIASLLLGCNPQASTQPPEDGAGDGGAAAAVTEPADGSAPGTPSTSSDASEPVAADAGEATEPADAGDGGTAVADAGNGGAAVTDAVDGGTTEPEPKTEPKPEPKVKPEAKPVVATLELPKPLHSGTDAKCGKDPGVGQRLKSFSLPGLEEGKSVTQGTFRGRVLVVNFWGTWCKPCLQELPEFDQLYRRYRKHGMTLLAIATDEDAAAVKELVDKRKLGAKIAIAGEDYAGQYGSPKFPFTFVVDHKGVIQASYRGYKPECLGQLEADIREQLQARAEAKAKHAKGG